MATLTIGEARPKTWKLLAWLIQIVEGVDHNHIFITWKDPKLGVRKVAEAKGSGSRFITNTFLKKDNYVVAVYHYNVEDEGLFEMEKWLWENLTSYGYKHIFGLFLMRLGKVLGFSSKNYFKDGLYSQVCVELGARAIEKATKINLPGDVEDYGLREFQKLNLKYGRPGDEEQIKRINAG